MRDQLRRCRRSTKNKTKFKPDGTSDTSLINFAQRYREAYCRAAVFGATIDTACQLWRWRLDRQEQRRPGRVIMRHPSGTDGAGEFCFEQ
eukprot:3000991-Pleurochrysis_carterae.AAC.1